MTTGKRSRADLLAFLDYLAAKGLMNPATAQSRKASAGAMLGVLSEEEASDMATIDLDQAMARFNNLNASKFTPGSLATYKSRTRSAIDDFLRYEKNPLGFKASTPTGARKPRKPVDSSVQTVPEQDTPTRPESVRTPMAENILPIPLRADLTIYIQGLPFDLSSQEARKIANVVLAMSAGTD